MIFSKAPSLKNQTLEARMVTHGKGHLLSVSHLGDLCAQSVRKLWHWSSQTSGLQLKKWVGEGKPRVAFWECKSSVTPEKTAITRSYNHIKSISQLWGCCAKWPSSLPTIAKDWATRNQPLLYFPASQWSVKGTNSKSQASFYVIW